MGRFTHFHDGFQLEDYLARTTPSSARDLMRGRHATAQSSILREIICNIQAGRGILPAHKLICNMKNVQEALNALSPGNNIRPLVERMRRDYAKFLDHLKIDSVLNRLSKVSSESSDVANMIGFCKSPIDPIPIPHMIRDSMRSLLGIGDDIISRIGDIGDLDIAGCSTPGTFNGGIYRTGVLKKMHDNWGAISTGKATPELVEDLGNDIDKIGEMIDETVEIENAVTGAVAQGGSDHAFGSRTLNTGMGVLHNASAASVSDNARIASQISALYDHLGKYPVKGVEGTPQEGREYGSIFEVIVESSLIDRLEREEDPEPLVTEKEPVFNYCNEIVGYREKVVEEPSVRASTGGTPPTARPGGEPGYNAGGYDTGPDSIEIAAGGAAGSGGGAAATVERSVVNRFSSAILFASSDEEMVKSGAVRGQMVYRTDSGRLFLRTREDFRTVSDFAEVGGKSAQDASAGAVISGKRDQIAVEERRGEHTVSIAENPVIPGVRVTVPSSAATDGDAPDGSLRHHPGLDTLQVRADSKWLNVVTGGGVSVTGARSASARGVPVYGGTSDDGVVDIRSVAASGAVTVTEDGGAVVVSEELTGSNAGTGAGQVFRGREGNDMEFRSIAGGAGITVSSSGDEIEIALSAQATEATAQTADDTPKTIMSSMSPADGRTWFVEAVAVGRSASSDFGAVKREFVANNDGGTVSLAGTGANRVNYAATGATGNWDLVVEGGSAIVFKVRGGAGQTVDWKISVRVTEV